MKYQVKGIPFIISFQAVNILIFQLNIYFPFESFMWKDACCAHLGVKDNLKLNSDYQINDEIT